MGRKINNDAAMAFVNGYNFKRSNTVVSVIGDGTPHKSVSMFLHGHEIAKKELGKMLLCDCGWQTVTTKARLNGILDFLGFSRIYQKDFIWYWKDGENWKDGIWNMV